MEKVTEQGINDQSGFESGAKNINLNLDESSFQNHSNL